MLWPYARLRGRTRRNRFSADVVRHMLEVLIKYPSIGFPSPSVLRGTNDGRVVRDRCVSESCDRRA